MNQSRILITEKKTDLMKTELRNENKKKSVEVDHDYVPENSSDSENANVLVTAGGTETDGVNQEEIVTLNIEEVEETNPGQAAESNDYGGRLKRKKIGLSAKEKQSKRREKESKKHPVRLPCGEKCI